MSARDGDNGRILDLRPNLISVEHMFGSVSQSYYPIIADTIIHYSGLTVSAPEECVSYVSIRRVLRVDASCKMQLNAALFITATPL